MNKSAQPEPVLTEQLMTKFLLMLLINSDASAKRVPTHVLEQLLWGQHLSNRAPNQKNSQVASDVTHVKTYYQSSQPRSSMYTFHNTKTPKTTVDNNQVAPASSKGCS